MSDLPARRESPIAKARAWVAFACLLFAPVDVLDVFGFSGDFRLTPFLLLSGLYLFIVILESVLGLNSDLLTECFGVAEAAAAVMLGAMVASILFLSHDPLHIGPTRLLYSSWLIIFAILFANRERPTLPRMIVRTTRLFILLDIVAVAAQIGGALAGFTFPKYLEGLAATSAFDLLRPGGVISDPNRACVMLVLLLGFAHIAGDELPKKQRLGVFYYVVGLVLASLTISRTGAVAVVLLMLVMFQRSKNKNKLFWRICLVTSVLLCAGVAYLATTRSMLEVTDFISRAFLERDVSNADHFGVMKEGVRLLGESPKVLVAGTGWGTEYQYTQSFFQGSKYANFHCTYISIAVQSGVVCLLGLLFLLFRPLILKQQFGSLAIIFLWSGVFYQYHGDPLWWILVFVLNKETMPGIRTWASLEHAGVAIPHSST